MIFNFIYKYKYNFKYNIYCTFLYNTKTLYLFKLIKFHIYENKIR